MEFLKNNKIIVLVCLVIIYFVYTNYFYNDISNFENDDENDNNNEYSTNENNKPIVYLYYADWCPHCKTMKPKWNEFKNNYKNLYDIRDVDCTNGTDNPDIKGFPTILLNHNNKITEMQEGVETYMDIYKFVNRNIN